MMGKAENEFDIENYLADIEKLKYIRHLQKKGKLRTEFFANMSHELRSPLHGILGFTDLGLRRINKDKCDSDMLKTYFKRIKETGDRLLIIINDILDLSKLESGKMTYEFEKINFIELCEASINELQSKFLEKNIKISINNFAGSYNITVDRERIIQVIVNFLSNAIKFSDTDSEIIIEFKISDGLLVFSIKDFGVGISESELESCFDRYIQKDKNVKGIKGTGLGLSISKQIILAHKGSIWASQNKPSGSIFSFTLPMDKNE